MRNSQRGAVSPWWLVMVLLLALGGVGWYGWQWLDNEHQMRVAMQAELDRLTRDQEEAEASFRQQGAEIALRIDTLDRMIDERDQQWRAMQEGGQQQWLMSEAEALASLASQRLLLTADLAATRRLLESADMALTRISDPAVITARRALAIDIEAVRGAEQVDVAAVVLRLAALQQLVAELAVPAQPVLPEPAEPLPAAPTWWQRLLHSLPIRIQRDPGQSVLPLDQQQAALVRLALDNSLQQAQMALLQARPSVYHAALDQAERLLVGRFPGTDPRARQLRAALDELRTEAVQQALPEIGRGLTAIRDLKAGTIR
jgi:uroporphyrin-III C-methyltransferase